MMVDPRAAIAVASEAKGIANEQTDSRRRTLMQATADWLTGEAHLRIDDVNSAEPYIRSALGATELSAPNSTLHADVLLSLGWIATEHGNVSEALDVDQQAHRIYQRLRDARGQAKSLIQIASLYYLGNDWNGALKYHGEALEVYGNDPGLAFSIRNGRGNAFKELGKIGEAQGEFDAARIIAREMKSPLLEATVLNNMARMALDFGKLPMADRAIAESMRVTGPDTPPEFRKQQWALAAQAAYQHGDYLRAKTLSDRAFNGVDPAKTTLADRDAHRTAYLIYEKLHRDDLALAHLRALKRLDDDATTLARSASAALMGARFDFANQALRIANLKAADAQKSVAYERTQARTQRWIFFGAAGATMVLIAMLLFALRTSRRARERVQESNADLAVTNDALGKALAAKTEFLATTSHEIRTPLNGILGMTQVMLVDRTVDPAMRERLALVHDAGTAMKALVDDILDAAKMDTGNLTIEHRPFNLRALAVAACEMWHTQARDKGLTFVCDVADCPQDVVGDGPRVRQILFNLLSNALKFTPSGTITLAVHQTAEGRCTISVADSGIGIAADTIDVIFESFRQADTSTTRRFGGTGLGLTISRNLARAMGGDVTVASVEGQGTTFRVDLPLPLVETAVPTAKAADALPIDLLIVDRSPITRVMLQTLFAPHYPVILAAESVADAVGAAVDREVAMVLLDRSAVAALDNDLASIRAHLDARVTLLWPETDREEVSHVEVTDASVIFKPITGGRLVGQIVEMNGSPSMSRLVPHAA